MHTTKDVPITSISSTFQIQESTDEKHVQEIVRSIQEDGWKPGEYLDVIQPDPSPDQSPGRKEISKEKKPRYRSLLADLAEAEIGLPKGEKTSTESELESCPFCGYNYPRILEDVPNFAGATWKMYRGECPECHALGPECRSKELAIETWNRSRTNDPD